MENRILLVTADEGKSTFIDKCLLQLGYPAETIRSYNTIAEAANAELRGIGLVIIAIPFTEINDVAVISALKYKFQCVPMILLTDDENAAIDAEAVRLGVHEVIAYKTVDAPKLERAIVMARGRNQRSTKITARLEDYRRHFENGPIPMCIIDSATLKFLLVNNATVQKYGYSKEEFSAMTLHDIRPGEDVEAMLQLLEKDIVYLDAGYWRHKKKNGEIFYVHIYSHATTFDNVPARLSFVVDVNDKLLIDKQNRELNEQLREQKEQLDSILFSINDAIWSRRADTNELIYANNAYYKLYDYDPEDMSTDNDFIFNSVYPDDRDIFLSGMQEVRDAGETEIVYRYYHKNGTLRTLKATAVYKKGINGKVDTIDGITIDISKEKELYDAIRNSEHKLLSTINNTQDLIWTVDKDLRIIFCNKPYQDHFYKVAGVLLDEGDYALGSWHSEAFIKRRVKEYQRALSGESFTTVIEEMKDGTVQYNEINSNPVFDHHGNIIGVNCIVRDITEQRMQLLKIQQQNEKLKEIAWIQSHKVRGPVASILGLISLVKDEAEAAHNAEIIGMLRKATTELDNIIREVVDKTNDIDYTYTYLPSVKTGR